MEVDSRVKVIVDDQIFFGHEGVIVKVATDDVFHVVLDNYTPADPYIDPKSPFAFSSEELEII